MVHCDPNSKKGVLKTLYPYGTKFCGLFSKKKIGSISFEYLQSLNFMQNIKKN